MRFARAFALAPVLASLAIAVGCQSIWYYRPVDAVKRAGQPYWMDLGEVEFESWSPFLLAPYEPGRAHLLWGIRLRDKTGTEWRLETVEVRTENARVTPSTVGEDRVHGFAIPPYAASEYTLLVSIPEKETQRPREWALVLELAADERRLRKEVRYAE